MNKENTLDVLEGKLLKILAFENDASTESSAAGYLWTTSMPNYLPGDIVVN